MRKPPEAALKLVSVHKNPAESTGSGSNDNADADMARATTLISLHQSVKMRYQEEGLDEELGLARSDVQRVLSNLTEKR